MAKKNGTQKTKPANGSFDIEAALSPIGLAHELAKSASALSQALETGKFCEPLEHNLMTWAAIKTLVNRQDGHIAAEITTDLGQMADFVTSATLAAARSGDPDAIVPLINIDIELSRQLSTALLDQMTRDRAYYRWQEAGCPQGNDQEHWFGALRDIQQAQAELA